jgi:hypothetical protein
MKKSRAIGMGWVNQLHSIDVAMGEKWQPFVPAAPEAVP